MSHFCNINIIYEIDHFIITCVFDLIDRYSSIYMIATIHCDFYEKKLIEYKTEISCCETKKQNRSIFNKLKKTIFINLYLYNDATYDVKSKSVDIENTHYTNITMPYTMFLIFNYNIDKIINIDEEYISNNSYSETNFDSFIFELIYPNGEIEKFESFCFYIDNIKYTIVSFIEDIFNEESFKNYIDNYLYKDYPHEGRRLKKNMEANLITDKKTYNIKIFENEYCEFFTKTEGILQIDGYVLTI